MQISLNLRIIYLMMLFFLFVVGNIFSQRNSTPKPTTPNISGVIAVEYDTNTEKILVFKKRDVDIPAIRQVIISHSNGEIMIVYREGEGHSFRPLSFDSRSWIPGTYNVSISFSEFYSVNYKVMKLD